MTMNTTSHEAISRRNLLRASGATLALAGAAQGASAQQAAPRRGGTLRVTVTQRVASLNPLKQINNPEYLVSELLNAGLTRIALNMSAEPELAERWEANAEATEFTFHLRRGAHFHHGPEVTSADVVATIRAVLDPATASPGRRNIGPIKEVVALGSRTVKFVLESPFADLPVNLAYPNARIVPAEILAKDLKLLDNADYGCGPFKLVRYEPDRGLRVERFERYHVQGQPYLDAVEVLLYPDVAAESAALINGETDLIQMVQPADFDRLSKSPGVVAMREKSGRFHNLVLRMDSPPFNDIRVRKALQLAIDRNAIADLVIEGTGRPAYDNPISPEYRNAWTPQPIARDVQRARRLLAEAGHGGGLKVTLHCANRPTTRTALGVAVREMARPAGFDIDVQTVPYDNYIANIWRKASFYVGTFNPQAHEDAMFTLLFTTDAPWNDSQWNNKSFDAWVYEARRTLDAGKRKALYEQAQKLMVEEVPYIIPFYEDLLAARRAYVNGYVLHPRGGVFPLERVWLGDGAPRRG
jgi:peptide/nickel transport system substrate-binding protein